MPKILDLDGQAIQPSTTIRVDSLGNLQLVDQDARNGIVFPATALAPNPVGIYRSADVYGPLDSVFLMVGSAPGAPIVCDILRSRDGLTWASIWASNPAGRPTLPAGATSVTIGADPTIVFWPTDWLVAGVISGAGTVTIQLTIRVYDSG